MPKEREDAAGRKRARIRPLLIGVLLAAAALAPLRCARAPAPARDRDAPSPGSPPQTSVAGARIVAVGRFEFESPRTADPTLWPEELSGLAWIEGDEYVAVGDAHAAVHRLRVRVDPATGNILEASTGDALPLRDADGTRVPEPARAEDREAIAYEAETRSVWIANERSVPGARGPSFERHRLEDGRSTGILVCDADPSLGVFARARPNRAFEALARAEDGSAYWAANEEPLEPDGPSPTHSTPGVVRLLKLDRTMRPLAQFAYVVDAYPAAIRTPALLAGREVSGLSELAVLPDGRLIALERAFAGDSTGGAALRTRLYLVDPRGATDLAHGALREGLAGRDFVPAAKTLLWEAAWGLTNSNFEGMALGPRLANGDRLLLLMADNNAGTSQALFALRLSGP